MDSFEAPQEIKEEVLCEWHEASYRASPSFRQFDARDAWAAMLVLLGHVAAGLLLAQWLQVRESQRLLEQVTVVEFIEQLPAVRRVAPAAEPVATAPPMATNEPSPSVPQPPAPRPRRRTAQAMQVVEPTPGTRPLLNADGSMRLPEGFIESIDDPLDPDREFSYQVRGMADGERLMAERPSPLVYEPTRFEEDWLPTEDMLTEILSKAVEATTKQIEIPLPGGRSKLVCQISLLAAGGGCVPVRLSSLQPFQGDDPDTLSVEEQRQCDAWWERIVGASTQDSWRRTRDLYEAQCRKPKE